MKNTTSTVSKIGLTLIAGLLMSACSILTPSKPAANSNEAPVMTCGIEQCHGLAITCGEKVPEFCTAVYQLGDFCQQYVNCRVENDSCQMVDTTKFDQCKTCVEKCQQVGNIDAFTCEEQCRAELQ